MCRHTFFCNFNIIVLLILDLPLIQSFFYLVAYIFHLYCMLFWFMSLIHLFLSSILYFLTLMRYSICRNIKFFMISFCLLRANLIATFLTASTSVLMHCNPSLTVYFCHQSVDFHPYNVANPSIYSLHCQYFVDIFAPTLNMTILPTNFIQKIHCFESLVLCSLADIHLKVFL